MILKFFIVFLFLTKGSFAGNFNITEAIRLKSIYSNYYESVFGNPNIARTELFKEELESLSENDKVYADSMIKNLSNHVPNDFLKAMVYWKVISKDSERFRDVLIFTMMYKSFILRDVLYSPTGSKNSKEYARKKLKELYHRKDFSQESFYSTLERDFHEKATIISSFKNVDVLIKAIKETNAITFSIENKFIPQYSLSFQGYIPGNELKLFNNDRTNVGLLKWYAENTIQPNIKNNSKIDISNHMSFIKNPQLIKIIEMIDEAQESILISATYLGGSLGTSLSNYLIEKVKEQKIKNKDFKIIIFHNANIPLSLSDEVNITLLSLSTKVLRDENLSNSFFIIKSNDSLIKNEDKVNHAKAIVIDGNTNYPQALLGSKNLADSNGGYSFDNSIWIKGPAAAVIQNSLYEDIVLYSKTPTQKKVIEKYFKITKEEYPRAGFQPLRITESDFKGHIKNTRNIIVDMIIHAKENIYMEQLYLLDPYVINAIIKKKIERPDIDIKIIIDNSEIFNMNGLPNSIFIKEFALNGINLRARKNLVLKSNTTPNTNKAFLQFNNRKVISVDGEKMVIGSADLSAQGLQGNQREIGVQIFDKTEIAKFEKSLLLAWADSTKTINLDIENFEANINGKTFSKTFSSLINSVSKAFLKLKNSINSKL
ncbi:phosphatidylserine/phosphatidylglycerophosphate/cardiolipin synthase family protein [Halobacteriovorax sp. HLS]|uniref:phospholipase D-like domain-containing protein n=1 Tax=Halobacteriovorax sp. HLS TaxID=2234000 RepID=UPI000FD6C400|nr:phosphatidylserine/phosphatidylglycerophosphate/cardiolipin synthase family protein [Halobacteriovorax sp. HLS]